MIKFNGGRGAIICDICSTIIKEDLLFDDIRAESRGGEDWEDVCEECNALLAQLVEQRTFNP